MSTDLEQLAPEAVDALVADTRTTRLKRRGNERRRRRSAAAALVLVPVFCLVGVVVSCGTDEDTAHVILSDASEDGVVPQQQTDNPPADLSPVELVRVPDVIGLSSREAHTPLEAAGFTVEVAIDAIPKTGVQPDTVTGTDPIPGTPAPFGSLVVLNVYVDSSMMDAEVIARVRIQQEVEAEFGDRIAGGYWDETTATFNLQIADLPADDIDRLQSLYNNEVFTNDEVFTVIFSAAVIGRADLHALNRSTQDLVPSFFLAECGIQASYAIGIGIDVETWSVFVNLPPDDAVGQSIDECISAMKEAVLANAADFAEEHSIRADPADLVRFRADPMHPEGPLYD